MRGKNTRSELVNLVLQTAIKFSFCSIFQVVSFVMLCFGASPAPLLGSLDLQGLLLQGSSPEVAFVLVELGPPEMFRLRLNTLLSHALKWFIFS